MEMGKQCKATSSIEQVGQNTCEAGRVLKILKEKMEYKELSRAETIRESSRSIFRFPKTLKDISPIAWQPEMASIGPYHNGNKSLNKMIERQKVRYLRSMVDRGCVLDTFVDAIKELVEPARLCYSEHQKSMDDVAFTEMLILDGCFIIELFFRSHKPDEIKKGVDPIFERPYVMPVLLRDLLKLENQIPFFILQRLFQLSGLHFYVEISLKELTIEFFNKALKDSNYKLPDFQKNDFQHLLDLFLSCFTSQFCAQKNQHSVDVQGPPPIHMQGPPPIQMIQCVRKLRHSKVKFKPRKTSTFLDITFKRCFLHAVLEIPPLVIDEFTSCVFINAIAYEQCCGSSSRHITSYAAFIDCLIDAPADVHFLYEDKIITRINGNEQIVAAFFNALGKAIVLDPTNCYLSKQFHMVDEYYRSGWATLMRTYFRTPWSFLSALSAVILLLLTVAQTIFSIPSYKHH